MRSRTLWVAATVLFLASLQGDRATAAAADNTADELIALDRQVEAAVLRQDMPYLEAAYTSDFVFTHGDGWRTGGKPLATDTKASWIKSIPGRKFVSREVGSQTVELHGDIALTMGRIDVVAAPLTEGGPKRESFFWYLRVYQRVNNRWLLVSHKTVDGPKAK